MGDARSKGRGWRPMSTAPKDGTMVLVCESPNGEQWYVLAACYASIGQVGLSGWWGVRYRASWSQFIPIACTPVCWRPFPKPDERGRLRRRKSAILRAKYPEPSPVIRSGPNYAFEDGDARKAANPR
jgi:hypothetical protein